MARRFKLLNKREVLKNLNKEIRAIEGRTENGMLLAAYLFLRTSRARTPVDTGNLKGGHYIVTAKTLRGYVAELGVMADYAVPVHENMEAKHPTGQAKFMESAIEDNTEKALNIIRQRARIKK